jgi:hypothetical protein
MHPHETIEEVVNDAIQQSSLLAWNHPFTSMHPLSQFPLISFRFIRHHHRCWCCLNTPSTGGAQKRDLRLPLFPPFFPFYLKIKLIPSGGGTLHTPISNKRRFSLENHDFLTTLSPIPYQRYLPPCPITPLFYHGFHWR